MWEEDGCAFGSHRRAGLVNHVQYRLVKLMGLMKTFIIWNWFVGEQVRHAWWWLSVWLVWNRSPCKHWVAQCMELCLAEIFPAQISVKVQRRRRRYLCVFVVVCIYVCMFVYMYVYAISTTILVYCSPYRTIYNCYMYMCQVYVQNRAWIINQIYQRRNVVCMSKLVWPGSRCGVYIVGLRNSLKKK